MKFKGFAVLSLLLIVMVALAVGCGGNSKGTSPTPPVIPSPSPSQTVAPSPSPTQSPIDVPNPLIHYTFDSSADDSSGNGLNGTLVGSAVITTADKKVGTGCLDLTSNTAVPTDENAYVTMPTFTLNDSYSVATWVKFTGYGSGWARLFHFYGTNGVAFIPNDNNTGHPDGPFTTFSQIVPGPEYAIWRNGNRAHADVTFPLNTWVHLVFVYEHSTGTVSMYINGTKWDVWPGDWAQVSLGTLTSNDIGHSSHPSDSEIQGYIDDFRVYNVALTETQAAALYNSAAQ